MTPHVLPALLLACAACAPPPEPAVWTVQETHERFDALEIRLVRGARHVNAYRSLRNFTEYRAARRDRQMRLARRP